MPPEWCKLTKLEYIYSGLSEKSDLCNNPKTISNLKDKIININMPKCHCDIEQNSKQLLRFKRWVIVRYSSSYKFYTPFIITIYLNADNLNISYLKYFYP